MSTPAELRTPETADQPVLPEQIADLAVYKNFAYLNSWSEPTCRRGGIFVVDISNPAQPRQVAFRSAAPNTRHGEGAQVITINTPAGPRDVLAVNNEQNPLPCPQNVPSAGGIDLWDVTNPSNPVLLARSVGDTGPPGQLVGTEMVHHAHSAFMWNDDSGRAFVVMTDNHGPEFGATDVDIWEITNPATPRPVAEHNLLARFDIEDQGALGNVMNHHDVVVKKINGVQTMLVSYWDAGYVKLDVDDPANPEYIGDTSFDGPDPLFPDREPPEGNAHQSEFSHDNRFILAADEDFAPYRLQGEITGGPNQGERFFEAGFPDEGPIVSPDSPLTGDTRFVGQGCDLATFPAATPGVNIAVAERGTCTFQAKTENADARGYDGIIIFNNVTGANAQCDELLGMDFTNYTGDAVAIFVARSLGFKIIDEFNEATYRCTDGNPAESTPAPAMPKEGSPVNISVLFDGWGYTHLYENGSGKLRHVGAFSIEEARDERFAVGFGDLSVHEFAADATENVAYSSYYSGGMRVFTFGPQGLTETGKFIDRGGNNFWGVEQFTLGNQRYFAGSDRDFGLYLFRYTGPGAAQPPGCSDLTVMVAYRESANVPLNCSDPNANPLRQSRLSSPGGGTVTDRPPASGWTYQHTGSTLGPAGSFTFRANDGAADSNVATANLVAVAKRGRCVNPFVGTNRRDTIIGSRFGDRIRGRRAGDSLRGRAGRDCVLGNAGRDRISGHGHADRLLGNGGRDRVAGNAGRDRLFGNRGNDRLLGGGGRDRLRGGPGRNRYLAGAGADRVFARNDKRDRIRCGKGRDRVVADQNDRVAGDCERVRRG